MRVKINLVLITVMFLFVGIESVKSQEVKLLSKETLKIIKEKEQKIRVNEEMLISGVEGLQKSKSKLERLKKNNKITPEELAKKERILTSIEQRLNHLDLDIKNQKEKLNEFKQEKYKEENKSVTSVAVVKKEDKVEAPIPSTELSKDEDIESRKERLKVARAKLEEERLLREEAHKKEEEKLALLDNEIKIAEEEIKKKKEAEQNKILAEKAEKLAKKQKEISNHEIDISVNEEILASGREGLTKSKERLEKAKSGGNSSAEDIARKEAVIRQIEEKLKKIEEDINVKKALVKTLKEQM